jgi:hypothetical protein
MTRFSFLFIFVAALATACHPAPEAPIQTRSNAGDSNQDNVQDVDQSFGFGYDDRGNLYLTIWNGPKFGMVTEPWMAGYGNMTYSGSPNGWEDPFAKMVDYRVDQAVVGKAWANIRDGQYEVACRSLDAQLGQPDGWCNLGLDRRPGDDMSFMHFQIDGDASCPRNSWHLLFEVYGGDLYEIDPLAAPDPTCY